MTDNKAEVLYIETPWPPSVNHYYVQTKYGMFTSSKGKSFRQDVEQCALEQGVYGASLDYTLQVDVILYAPDKRIRDLDNYMKPLLDAITSAKIWLDDSQIDCLFIHRGVSINKAGCCKLRIVRHHGFILPLDDNIWDSLD